MRRRDRRLRAAGALVVLGAVALGGCAAEPDSGGAPVAGVSISEDDGLNGIVLPQAYDVPPVELTATDGAPYSLAADPDRPLTLVFFGYTHCPDICQLVMADIASALTRLDEQQRAQIGMQFVTTDPARDDRATLRAYLDRFDPSFGGLTGPLEKIVKLGTAMGVPVAKGARLPSGGYEVDHGTNVIGVAPDGTAPVVWTQGTGPELMAEDLRTILDGGVPVPPEQTGGTS
ncbi:SCO family protein [Nocardioides mesophilus]|uniref:SCO family protein n=1 Tax=Nocardioides mesophilus TaxID=433659 RepID=A0A7G9RBT0_9ACTN|nr:SCO family protein [Nocardioides mesophilus]QNN53055.1 SCO family protein [Nocardioides mesophilus]